MKGNKITVLVKVEVLSIDSVPALLYKATQEITEEALQGQIVMSDGDCVEWGTSSNPIEF